MKQIGSDATMLALVNKREGEKETESVQEVTRIARDQLHISLDE